MAESAYYPARAFERTLFNLLDSYKARGSFEKVLTEQELTAKECRELLVLIRRVELACEPLRNELEIMYRSKK